MENNIIIGIDPAFRQNGFAICIIENKKVSFKTFASGFLDFQEWVNTEFSDIEKRKGVFVCVENSNLQNYTFNKFQKASVAERSSRNVGANQAISQLTYDFCVRFFWYDNVKEISPQQKGSKKKKEIDKDIDTFFLDLKCRKLTLEKETKVVGQDKRDAYFIAIKGFANEI